jgi:glycosyltransferase involved in cell wall biosynthesis
MKIAVIFGVWSCGTRPLNFNELWTSPRGLTGSDLGVVVISKELAVRGHDVHLFTAHVAPANKPQTWENVNLYNFEERNIIDDSFDAIISINEPDVFRGINSKALKVCWQFLNDFTYSQPGYDDFVDVWLSPCEMHMEYLKKLVPKPEKWSVLSLGCTPEWYEDKRVPGRVIWTSSCDRGLHWLLNQWPTIKEAVPYATLKIFYHFNYDTVINFEHNSGYHPHIVEMAQRMRYIREMAKKLKPLGVEHVGSISRADMEKEASKASVFAFPVDTVAFSEGFSVSTLEAHASFTVPVITDADCLGSIYKDSGAIVIKSPVREHLPEFTDAVIKGLTNKEFADGVIEKCRAFASNHAWSKVAEKMESIIKTKIG